MTEEEMQNIIDAYTDALINTKHIVGKQSELPFEKSQISEVLLQAYKNTDDAEEKEIIKEAYMRLDSFLTDDDYEVVSKYLTSMTELNDTEISQEKLFEMLAEKIPDTALEVIDIFDKIEAALNQRREELEKA